MPGPSTSQFNSALLKLLTPNKNVIRTLKNIVILIENITIIALRTMCLRLEASQKISKIELDVKIKQV